MLYLIKNYFYGTFFNYLILQKKNESTKMYMKINCDARMLMKTLIKMK